MIDVRFQGAETPLPRPTGGWKHGPFKASFRSTLEDLERELGHLCARDIVVIADMPRESIRLDGWPRSTATARTPGVTITFTCRHGQLRYDCNTYNHWETNIRAFALTLERLRAIDRYGCTKGEQYAGWRALPAGEGKRSGGGFSTAEDAARFIIEAGGYVAVPVSIENYLRGNDGWAKSVYRAAARKLHPDSGGTAESFALLQEAKRLIEGAA